MTERAESLQRQREGLEDQLEDLNHMIAVKSGEIRPLEEKEKCCQSILCSEEESIRKMIEERLIALKLEKPELFYVTNTEQIAKLGAIILKWFLS